MINMIMNKIMLTALQKFSSPFLQIRTAQLNPTLVVPLNLNAYIKSSDAGSCNVVPGRVYCDNIGPSRFTIMFLPSSVGHLQKEYRLVWLMVFDATFNNISVISWREKEYIIDINKELMFNDFIIPRVFFYVNI